MPRQGSNPMRWNTEVYKPRDVTATLLVYIPFLDGYWKQSLEVLEICIASLRENTALPFDLLVFDNGSCGRVQEYLRSLHQEGIIQFLMLSHENMGKSGAWNLMLSAAPGDIVTYSDSDTLFLPGWLEASLEVLDAFPKAGMITAQPARGRPNFYEDNSTTLAEAPEDDSITIERGELIPQEYLTALRHGLGDTKPQFADRVAGQEEVLLSRNGVGAYVSASHFQFITTKGVLKQVLPFEVINPYGDDVQLIKRINERGFWRLSTRDYLAHHMGNTVPSAESDYDGLAWIDPKHLHITNAGMTPTNSEPGREGWLIDNRPLQYLLSRSRVKHFVRRLNVLTHRLLTG